MAVKLNCQQNRSGWLILDYITDNIHKNIFVTEEPDMTDQWIFDVYGARTKAILHISAHEYRRLRRECGV